MGRENVCVWLISLNVFKVRPPWYMSVLHLLLGLSRRTCRSAFIPWVDVCVLTFRLLWITQLWKCVCTYLSLCFRCFGLCLRVDLRDHVVIVFHFLSGRLFSAEVKPFYISQQYRRIPVFLHPCQQVLLLLFLNCHYPSRCEVVARCGFDSHFPNGIVHLFVWSLDIRVSSLEKCLLKSFVQFYIVLSLLSYENSSCILCTTPLSVRWFVYFLPFCYFLFFLYSFCKHKWTHTFFPPTPVIYKK